jgi:hypothetical protein
MTIKSFCSNPETAKKEIWELTYADTSEEEDDETESEGESDDSEEEAEEETNENKNEENKKSFIETESGEKMTLKNDA